MSIRIQLEHFEGPLGLLLHLIRKNEMDIYDIEIHKITQQYLEYIQVMKELDLEVAGEFVSLAAFLINIKSKMLLPQYDAQTGEPVVEDPRKELVDRLLEYQRFQETTKWFKDRHVLGRDTWKRGLREIWSDGEDAIILDEGGLFAMIALYRKALKKAQRGVHVVMEKMQSLASRIMELKDLLIPGQTIVFSDLIPKVEWTKTKLVLTFMSILELSRLGFTSIYQNEDCGPIHVNTKRPIEKDIVAQVQELHVQEPVPEVAYTTMVANVFEEEQLELSATDNEIEELEKQIFEQEISTPVSFEESTMLAELSERIEAVPELNQQEEIIAPILNEVELQAVEDLSRMESDEMKMESVPEDSNPVRITEHFEKALKAAAIFDEEAREDKKELTEKFDKLDDAKKPDGEILT